MLMKFKS